MNKLDKYLSIAIKVQAAREGMTLKDIQSKAGIGQTTFTERINNHRSWAANEIDKIAKALGLTDGIALYDIARNECDIAEKHVSAARTSKPGACGVERA